MLGETRKRALPHPRSAEYRGAHKKQFPISIHKGILLFSLTVGLGLENAWAQLSFSAPTSYGVGRGPASIVAVDINGDGTADLVCANLLANTFTVLTNDGAGGFVSNATYSASATLRFIMSADVNRDGKADIISASQQCRVWTNNGSGRLVLASLQTFAVIPQQQGVAADLNGDGRVDLLFAFPGTNSLMLLTNSGQGVFAAGSPFPPVQDQLGAYCAVAKDVNGDGKLDTLEVVGDGNIPAYLRVCTNDGTSAFHVSSTNTLATRWPGSIATVDVNGDGKFAVIVSDYASGTGTTLQMLTNNGVGLFGSNSTYTVGLAPSIVGAWDLDGDGWLDLVSAGNVGLTILTNNHQGGFGYSMTLNTASIASSVFAADLNADGKLDLVSANFGANTLSVFMNQSSFPPLQSVPALTINRQGDALQLSWPSTSPGWSLQQNSELSPTNWQPGGYDGLEICDDGTNKRLIIVSPAARRFFRLMHP